MSKSTEKPKRLTPTNKTLRSLYLRSGNVCAIKNCNNVIIDNAGTMIGHICHIEAALSNGARFNKNMTNEQRRAPKNLMLLCANHHAAIDGNRSTYSVVELRQIKTRHEKRFSEIGNTLKHWFEGEYIDNTTLIQESMPKSLKRMRAYYKKKNDELTDDDVAQTISEIKRYLSRARLVPQPEREFMRLLFNRAKCRGFQHGKVIVDCDDFKSAYGYPLTKMRKQAKLLEQNEVGSLYVEDAERASLRLTDPSDYVGWAELDGFCDANSIDIGSFLIELQFGLLD